MKNNIRLRSGFLSKTERPQKFICSDVACWGNPGMFEYRVMNESGKILFNSEKFKHGTNNIGEFLGIVQAFEYLYVNNINAEVFSDSQVAILWVNAKKCKTKEGNASPDTIQAVYFAEKFLQKIETRERLFFWQNKNWGEIPADYNRK